MPTKATVLPQQPEGIITAAEFDALKADGLTVTRRTSISLHRGGSFNLIVTDRGVFAVVYWVKISEQVIKEITPQLDAEREKEAAEQTAAKPETGAASSAPAIAPPVSASL